MKTYKCEHCNDIMNEDDDVWETFEDEILIPKIMDSQKNDFFGGFIKNLSSFSRRFL